MTKDEAKTILLGLSDNPLVVSEYLLEALDLAIKALEHTELNPSYNSVKTELDCISREAVIRLVEQYPNIIGNRCSGLIADIKHLPSVTPKAEWIPCSERLPDTDDKVLCWYEYYHWSQEKVLPEYGVGCYLRETSAWLGEVANGKDVKVIAWMPLPQPYKEGEDDKY